MPGVPTDFAEHKLHVPSDAKPVKQPLRRLSEEKRRIVGEEIARLLAAGFIMAVFFPEWLANCRCQNRRISGKGSRTVRLRSMVTGDAGHNVYPGSGPLYGGNTLLPA